MRTQQIITAILLAIGAAVAIYEAVQPKDGLLKFKVKNNIAYGYGGTDRSSGGVIKTLMNDHPLVDTIVLKRMPGTQDADLNLRLARDIRRRRLDTHLESNSLIASGAVDLFLAGQNRTMECGAHIGVHSWSISGTHEDAPISPQDMGGDRRQKLHETFLRDMGIDPAFYAFTRAAAEPEDIHYMTLDEIKRFDLLTEYPDC